jgi:hypothetical protein
MPRSDDADPANGLFCLRQRVEIHRLYCYYKDYKFLL